MKTLLALVIAVAASAVLARPPSGLPLSTTSPHEELPLPPTREYLKNFPLPHFLWPGNFAQTLGEQPNPHHLLPSTDWLDQELSRLNRMQVLKPSPDRRRVLRTAPYAKRVPSPYYAWHRVQPYHANLQWPSVNMVVNEAILRDPETKRVKPTITLNTASTARPMTEERKTTFALTPNDPGYFEPTLKSEETFSVNLTLGGGATAPLEGQHVTRSLSGTKLPRHTRENPNIGRHGLKMLVASELGELRRGLVPGQADLGSDVSASGTFDSFYGVALLSGFGVCVVLAVFGIILAWYMLSQRAKAVADVDYPAYGVTGPTINESGDRKLAHSAHLYHYQHQKQQIIAMERTFLEQRSGSATDPDSEDDNEEGDYTVYECPGFATTGDMEVENPLFEEEPTPATLGKCDIVKSQPQE